MTYLATDEILITEPLLDRATPLTKHGPTHSSDQRQYRKRQQCKAKVALFAQQVAVAKADGRRQLQPAHNGKHRCGVGPNEAPEHWPRLRPSPAKRQARQYHKTDRLGGIHGLIGKRRIYPSRDEPEDTGKRPGKQRRWRCPIGKPRQGKRRADHGPTADKQGILAEQVSDKLPLKQSCQRRQERRRRQYGANADARLSLQ